MPAYWINDQMRDRERAKRERDMRASSAGGCIIIPLAALPFLCGGFVLLVIIVHSAFGKSDFQRQMDAQHLTVVQPNSLQGRALNTNSAYQQGNAKRASDLTDAMGAASMVAAVYGSSSKDFIILAASQGGFMKSADRIDRLLSVPIGGTVTDIRSADPGPFGGVAKCGTVSVRDIPVGICAWIDDGTAGAIAIYGADVKQAAKILIAARAEVEQRI
ncbi:hypothetical protein [Dactylosporangium sp. NPDC051541]|uniref:hypothetical protein n=1 Tax=Dactylosporangium sp. NPDC051541 TaxID=3363977 RepID=UPI00379224B1